jgi:hypothetical protein
MTNQIDLFTGKIKFLDSGEIFQKISFEYQIFSKNNSEKSFYEKISEFPEYVLNKNTQHLANNNNFSFKEKFKKCLSKFISQVNEERKLIKSFQNGEGIIPQIIHQEFLIRQKAKKDKEVADRRKKMMKNMF